MAFQLYLFFIDKKKREKRSRHVLKLRLEEKSRYLGVIIPQSWFDLILKTFSTDSYCMPLLDFDILQNQ